MNRNTIFLPGLPLGRKAVLPNSKQLGGCIDVSIGTIACLTFASAFLIINAPLANAQQADVKLQEEWPQSILLRGTTGSGEQAAVFSESEPISSSLVGRQDDLEGTGSVDTTDSVRQLQGRARPVQREPQVVDPLVVGTPSARSNVRTSVEQEGIGATPQDDPFSALGLRVGSWRAFSSVEQTAGYSTNINGTAGGDGAAFSQTQVDLSLQSDWSRHSARLDATGTFRRAFDSEVEDLPAAGVTGGLSLDLIDGLAANFGANYNYATESVTSSTITSSAAERPGVHAFGGSAEIARTDRRLIYSLRGSVGRTTYEDIKLTSGGTESQQDRNNTLYSVTGRVGYEATAVLTPYVELEAGMRDYDLKRDRNGDVRDSILLGARAGVEVDLDEKLKGELSIGYLTERFEGDNLEDLSSLTLDGNIVWSPERDTTITFDAQTGFSGSTTSGQNGSVIFGAGVTAERNVTDRLSLSANAGVDISRQDDGSRTDTAFSAGAGFNYWINRFMALAGSVEHTTQRSTDAASEYQDLTVRGGIKFQR
ncbi:MAG: outer membrane beta-barrel protein [Salaquimonas sp.]